MLRDIIEAYRETPATRYIGSLRDDTREHPDDPAVRELGHAKVSITLDGDSVRIGGLMTYRIGSGHVTSLLGLLCSKADETGVELKTTARDNPDGMGADGVAELHRRYGFQEVKRNGGQIEMVRRPRNVPSRH